MEGENTMRMKIEILGDCHYPRTTSQTPAGLTKQNGKTFPIKPVQPRGMAIVIFYFFFPSHT